MDVKPWRSINDGVMGGLSAGGMVQSDSGLKFSGRLSLEN
ncbi:CIA30 family protein, partial [Pseudomonadota bacterium]